MLDQYIQLGQRIELKSVTPITTDAGHQELRKIYNSKVYDVLSDERLEILMPYEQRKLILLPVHSEYTIYFYTDGGIYECRARIVDRYKMNNVFILVVELLTSLKKYQRREYYRHTCVIALQTRQVTEEEIELMKKPVFEFDSKLPMQKSVIVDISGGGLRFISADHYEIGSIVLARFFLDIHEGRKEYEVTVKVLKVQNAEKRPGYFEYRVQFQNLANKKREEIIQYIFQEERKNRKREKGLQ